MWLQHSEPFIVRLAPPAPPHQTTLGEIILSSLAIVGVGVVLAVCCGAIVALLVARWRHRHPAHQEGPPSINPLAADESRPPSRPDR